MGAFGMEDPFLNYYLGYGRVYGISDGGRYQGRRIDSLGPRRHLTDFAVVSVAWIDVTSCTLPEASIFVGEPLERRVVSSDSGWVGTASLQEGATDLLDLSSLVEFCDTKNLAMAQNLDDAVRMAQG